MRYREVPADSFFVVLNHSGPSALLHKGEDGMPRKVFGVNRGWGALVTAELSQEEVDILSTNPEVQPFHVPPPLNYGTDGT